MTKYELCQICKKPLTSGDLHKCGCGTKYHKSCFKQFRGCPYCNKKVKLQIAQSYKNSSQYDKAIEIYKEYNMLGDVKRLESLISLPQAKKYENAGRYEEAIKIYKKLGKQADVRRLGRLKDLNKAKNFETALNFDKAIEIYEQYEMWKEAGRCRKLRQQHTTPNSKIEIGKLNQSTRISDSVIQRSSIGGISRSKISICPYCGEELNFPETPRFCPYCRKQILS